MVIEILVIALASCLLLGAAAAGGFYSIKTNGGGLYKCKLVSIINISAGTSEGSGDRMMRRVSDNATDKHSRRTDNRQPDISLYNIKSGQRQREEQSFR